jgi:hypothetical protein
MVVGMPSSWKKPLQLDRFARLRERRCNSGPAVRRLSVLVGRLVASAAVTFGLAEEASSHPMRTGFSSLQQSRRDSHDVSRADAVKFDPGVEVDRVEHPDRSESYERGSRLVRVPGDYETLEDLSQAISGGPSVTVLITADLGNIMAVEFSDIPELVIVGDAEIPIFVDGTGEGTICHFTNIERLELRNLCFRDGGLPGDGLAGSVRINGGEARIEGCRFSNHNAPGVVGGALFISNATCRILYSTFTGNHAYTGAAIQNEGDLVAAGCRFVSNTSGYIGGAVRSIGHQRAHLQNCVFLGNSSIYGGAVENYAGRATYSNCTFAGNQGSGGTIGSHYGRARLVNCILAEGESWWGDVSGISNLTADDLLPGVGNVVDDPLLDRDLRPLPGSPCIDAGAAVHLARADDFESGACGWFDRDLEGEPRFQDDPAIRDLTCRPGSGAIDIGAFEFAGRLATPWLPCDLDGNGLVGAGDLGVLLGAWGVAAEWVCGADLDADGLVDGSDLAIMLADWGQCR